jgi:hypothetical protein
MQVQGQRCFSKRAVSLKMGLEIAFTENVSLRTFSMLTRSDGASSACGTNFIPPRCAEQRASNINARTPQMLT